MRLERDNRKDTPEYAFQAFKFGTYSKVVPSSLGRDKYDSSCPPPSCCRSQVLSLDEQVASLAVASLAVFISHKVSIQSLYKRRFPHKSDN